MSAPASVEVGGIAVPCFAEAELNEGASTSFKAFFDAFDVISFAVAVGAEALFCNTSADDKFFEGCSRAGEESAGFVKLTYLSIRLKFDAAPLLR